MVVEIRKPGMCFDSFLKSLILMSMKHRFEMKQFHFPFLSTLYITRRLLRRSHWPQNEEIRAMV